MKIVANTNSLLTPLTGIGQYAYHLLSALKEVDRENEYMYYYGFFSKELSAYVPSNDPSGIQSLDQYKIRAFQKLKKHLKQIPVIGPLGKELRTLYSKTAQRLRSPHFDLYFEPNFIPLGEIKTDKIVTMIFDLSVILHPEWHPQERVENFNRHFRNGIEKSNLILTATQHVKNQIVETLKVPEEKIHVTPISCNALFQNAASLPSQNHMNLPEHFLLFVGSIEPRKNIL
ncbi:MAG: hypothetical protein HYS58_03940, partial [Elusimicrobia bacterium]|nr:hypothetical protein [Elusimicrobiota bacterium]